MPGAAQTPGDYTAPAERPLCAATAPWTEAAEQVPPSLRNPKTRRATADSTRRSAGGAHLIQENVTGEGADGHGLAGLPTGQELLHAAPTCSRYGAGWRRKAQEAELCGARGVQGKPHHEMNRAVHSWAMNGLSATCERRHAEARREGAQARRKGGGAAPPGPRCSTAASPRPAVDSPHTAGRGSPAASRATASLRRDTLAASRHCIPEVPSQHPAEARLAPLRHQEEKQALRREQWVVAGCILQS